MAYFSLRHLTIHLLVHEQRPARRLTVERARREGGGGDSNPRPPGPQPGALPTELPPPRPEQDSGGPARQHLRGLQRPLALLRVLALGELLEHLRVERRDVVRLSARHEPLLHDDLLVDPGAAG